MILRGQMVIIPLLLLSMNMEARQSAVNAQGSATEKKDSQAQSQSAFSTSAPETWQRRRLGQILSATHIYRRPDNTTKKLTIVKADTFEAIQGREKDWYQVLMQDESTGWVPATAVRLLSDIITPAFPVLQRVPQMARLIGVRVGYDTLEKLEARLGHGLAVTGGHPMGAREWRSRQTGWIIHADAFDTSDKGMVLDELIIRFPDVSDRVASLPSVNLSRRRLGLFGVVFPGMTRAEVLHAIRGRLPAPTVKENRWSWTESGFASLADREDYHVAYRIWKAAIVFEKERVVSLALEAE